jgi:hypothetical protein
MNPGNSQFSDWEHGGHTVPGGLDDLGRKTHRITVLNPDFWDTEPVPMDAGELRRDAIAAAAQAPRIPRNRPIVGTSQQGRVIHRAGDLPQPTEPVMTEMDWVRFDHRVLYPVCVLALLACAAAVFDVRWTDAVQLLAVIGGAR